jgi:DNA-directed RNA polymerase specialized sigma24 family protein
MNRSGRGSSRDGEFVATQWSVVLNAADPDSPRHRACLAALCETYWLPLYAYLRRGGATSAQAEDSTQAFFTHLLSKQNLRHADPDRGRFRSFLLTCLKHFTANERQRAAAQKRGGNKPVLSFDFAAAESVYTMEPAHDMTPEKIFDRRWALTVLDRVSKRLREEFIRDGKREQFERLGPFLTQRASYAEVAAALHTSAGAARVAVHRMRNRYRDLLREEVAQTVAGPEEIDQEIRDLLSALGG